MDPATQQITSNPHLVAHHENVAWPPQDREASLPLNSKITLALILVDRQSSTRASRGDRVPRSSRRVMGTTQAVPRRLHMLAGAHHRRIRDTPDIDLTNPIMRMEGGRRMVGEVLGNRNGLGTLSSSEGGSND